MVNPVLYHKARDSQPKLSLALKFSVADEVRDSCPELKMIYCYLVCNILSTVTLSGRQTKKQPVLKSLTFALNFYKFREV